MHLVGTLIVYYNLVFVSPLNNLMNMKIHVLELLSPNTSILYAYILHII
jgi:hypothetical protein